MPQTVKYYAFFDVDGTLVKGVSMLNFLRFYYRKRFEHNIWIGNLAYNIYLIKSWMINKLTQSRERLNRFYYHRYQNQSVEWIRNLGQVWYKELKNSEGIFFNLVIHELRWHQQLGAEVVFVSGSFGACLEPIANELGVNHILCTELLHQYGRFTGKIRASMIGNGKVEAIKNFLKSKEFFQLNICYAYGDHMSDLPMLKLVGNSRVISGDKKLECWAKQHETPILKVN
jgi:HAD superfamily hydrolase (TIGR01490 family)